MFTEKPNAVNNIALYYSRMVETCSETVVVTNMALTQTRGSL